MLLDIACGMEYVHSMNIIHGVGTRALSSKGCLTCLQPVISAWKRLQPDPCQRTEPTAMSTNSHHN